MKKIIIFLLALGVVFSLTACGNGQTAKNEETEGGVNDFKPEVSNGGIPGGMDGDGKGTGKRGGNGGGRGGNRGGMMMENDAEIQAVLDENADKFEQFTFEDAKTGIALEYSLYVPADYDGSAVWVTDEDQKKHPSFVMAPAFTETVVDDNWNVSEQIEAAVHLISKLQADYGIDSNRIYATGQSMGCMTSLHTAMERGARRTVIRSRPRRLKNYWKTGWTQI